MHSCHNYFFQFLYMICTNTWTQKKEKNKKIIKQKNKGKPTRLC